VDEASGQPYWFNKETGESSWEDPTKSVCPRSDCLASGGLCVCAVAEVGAVSRLMCAPWSRCFLFPFSCRDDAVEEEAAAAGEAEGEAEVEGEGEAEQAVEDTEEWDVFHDDSGTPFFTNRVTGESVWDKPETFREWEELLDADSGVPYYFNRVSNETVWERPATFEKVWFCRRLLSLLLLVAVYPPTPHRAPVRPGVMFACLVQTMGDWTEKVAEDGKLFYVSKTSGESVWERPTAFGILQGNVVVESDGESDDEGGSWVEDVDPSTNRKFWYNKKTEESTWVKPSKKGKTLTVRQSVRSNTLLTARPTHA